MKALRRTFFLWLLMVVSCPLSMLAQKSISGVVHDTSYVVISATVTAKNSNNVGAITDINGAFKLTVPNETKEIVVSYVGYKTTTVNIQESQLSTLPSRRRTTCSKKLLPSVIRRCAVRTSPALLYQ